MPCLSGGLKESALFHRDFLPPFLFGSPDYNNPRFEKDWGQGQKGVLWARTRISKGML